jgi:hypothetical protein
MPQYKLQGYNMGGEWLPLGQYTRRWKALLEATKWLKIGWTVRIIEG